MNSTQNHFCTHGDVIHIHCLIVFYRVNKQTNKPFSSKVRESENMLETAIAIMSRSGKTLVIHNFSCTEDDKEDFLQNILNKKLTVSFQFCRLIKFWLFDYTGWGIQNVSFSWWQQTSDSPPIRIAFCLGCSIFQKEGCLAYFRAGMLWKVVSGRWFCHRFKKYQVGHKQDFTW